MNDTKECCICSNGDDPQPVMSWTNEVEIDGHRVYVEEMVMPITDDETKYICEHCTKRALGLSFTDMVAPYRNRVNQ